jgi:transposase
MRHYVEDACKEEDFSEGLGTDETSKCKGHDYGSLIVDLDESKTIFVVEGKGSDTVTAFTQDLLEHGGKPENITDVSIDMSQHSLREWRIISRTHKSHLMSFM